MHDDEITRWLFLEDDPVRGQCAVVLGCSQEAEMRRRVARAVELYEKELVERLVLSGGGSEEPSEAEVMADMARDLGVSEARMVLETHSTNTFENALLARDALASADLLSGLDTLLLVTSGWHMRRAALITRKAFPRVRVVCCPTREGCTRETWTRSPSCRRVVEGEAHLLQLFLEAGLMQD